MERSRAWCRRLLISGGAMLTTTALLLATAPPASAAPRSISSTISSTFQDGFETPVAPVDFFSRAFAVQPLGEWTVVSGAVDLIGEGFWEHDEGVQSLTLNGGQPGAVATEIDTTLLLGYRVSYSLAGNVFGGPTVKTGQVLLNGNVVQNFSFNVTGKTTENMGYVRKSFTFILSLGQDPTLEFRSTTPGGAGPVIDNVRVETCLLIIC